MSSIVVIDESESRGALVKEILEADGYDTIVLESLKEATDYDWERFPDAIFLAENETENALETGVGTLICTDSDLIDPQRLDALILLALARSSTSDHHHDIEMPSWN